MMGKYMLGFFMSLALGYVLCILAKKQTSILKTLGYTLGIAIMVLTFLSALLASQSTCMNTKGYGHMDKMGKMGCPMMKSMHTKTVK